MKKLLLIALLGLSIATPALAEDEFAPVNDRCAMTDVLKTLFEVMTDIYPARFAERPSFVFDGDSIITRAYDRDLNKVTCYAKFTLQPDLIDATKKSWVLAANKLGIKSMPKIVHYEMQYLSGRSDRFRVSIQNMADENTEVYDKARARR